MDGEVRGAWRNCGCRHILRCVFGAAAQKPLSRLRPGIWARDRGAGDGTKQGLRAQGYCAPGFGAQAERVEWGWLRLQAFQPVLLVDPGSPEGSAWVLLHQHRPWLPAEGDGARVGPGLTPALAWEAGAQALSSVPEQAGTFCAGAVRVGVWAGPAPATLT